jgi:hypothetical protein
VGGKSLHFIEISSNINSESGEHFLKERTVQSWMHSATIRFKKERQVSQASHSSYMWKLIKQKCKGTIGQLLFLSVKNFLA